MRPARHHDSGQQDLLRSRLDQIVDPAHALVKMAHAIDWRFLEDKLDVVYTDGAGQPPLPTRLMAGMAILKHMHNLSDEVLCARWLENPYYQLFCGEAFFCHALPFDRSSLSRWRQRMGEERLNALLQESLALATRSGAAKPADFTRVIVDTTVQPKAITFPTDAKLLHRARVKLVRLAQMQGVRLRQSYIRLGKTALIQHQRYAHAKQFKRANRSLKRLRTYLGRVIRDVDRKTAGDAAQRAVFAPLLALARRVHAQRPRQRGPKVYSLHAPEVECISKGKAHRPYEFGVKVSVATPLQRCRGGQFVAHVAALPGNPYDGHSLAKVIPALIAQTGASLIQTFTDAGYRGHKAPLVKGMRVYTAGQKRGVTEQIRRQMRRRSAIEPVIGHLKAEHRMERNHLAGRHGDAANAVLAAIGYNFSLLLKWFSQLLRAWITELLIQLATRRYALPQA
ncbi:MAG: IS5 family transposase [Rhodospirillales bacterium]|nr:IS5 family transposase [Acetobacter sp.]